MIKCPSCGSYPMLIDDGETYLCPDPCLREHVLQYGILITFEHGDDGGVYYSVAGRPSTEEEIETARQQAEFEASIRDPSGDFT